VAEAVEAVEVADEQEVTMDEDETVSAVVEEDGGDESISEPTEPTEPTGASESEDDLLVLDSRMTENKKIARRSPAPRHSAKTSAENHERDDNDWGIVQPELGF